jgi:hypothetical protein
MNFLSQNCHEQKFNFCSWQFWLLGQGTLNHTKVEKKLVKFNNKEKRQDKN